MSKNSPYSNTPLSPATGFPLALLLALGCAPAKPATRPVPTGPPPQVSEQTVAYDVEGRTLSELVASVNDKLPDDADGRWLVRWSFDYDRSSGQCRLSNVRATVEVTYADLHWASETPDVAPRWHDFVSALKTHQHGHAQNGIDAAKFIIAALEAVPPQGDCDAAGTLANAAANHELDLAHVRDHAYDEETNHGQAQGAILH
jgi:predicted secreted Zn-dependent protease